MKLSEVIHPLLEGKKVLDPDGMEIFWGGEYEPITFENGKKYSFYPEDILSDRWSVVDE